MESHTAIFVAYSKHASDATIILCVASCWYQFCAPFMRKSYSAPMRTNTAPRSLFSFASAAIHTLRSSTFFWDTRTLSSLHATTTTSHQDRALRMRHTRCMRVDRKCLAWTSASAIARKSIYKRRFRLQPHTQQVCDHFVRACARVVCVSRDTRRYVLMCVVFTRWRLRLR